jgi:hypothetical protein
MRNTTIRRARNASRAFACLLSVMCLISCAKLQHKPIGTAHQHHTQEVDSSNPVSVAEAFFAALAREDIAEALQQVLPEQRSDSEKELQKGFPPIPPESTFEIELESITEKEKAQVGMKGEDFGADLIYEGGRWWIVK